jgi:hypothetical protein
MSNGKDPHHGVLDFPHMLIHLYSMFSCPIFRLESHIFVWYITLSHVEDTAAFRCTPFLLLFLNWASENISPELEEVTQS